MSRLAGTAKLLDMDTSPLDIPKIHARIRGHEAAAAKATNASERLKQRRHASCFQDMLNDEARKAGAHAFVAGQPRVADAERWADLTKATKVGEGNWAPVTAWYAGWDRANMLAPLPEEA